MWDIAAAAATCPAASQLRAAYPLSPPPASSHRPTRHLTPHRLLATVPEEDMQRAQRVVEEISRLDEEAAEEAATAAQGQQGSSVDAARLQSLL